MHEYTERDFLFWLNADVKFYMQSDRYGQFCSFGVVCVADFHEDEQLREDVDNLEAGDHEAIEAGERIKANCKWYESDLNPVLAMDKLVGRIRKFYFEELIHS